MQRNWSARILVLWCILATLPLVEPAHSDQVKYISQPDQALAEFIEVASKARHSLSLATFIFKPCDASTQILMDVLAHRAAAGVKVRVLLDSLTQPLELKQPIVDFFSQNGIEVAFYNCFLPEINSRMHIKFMVADGETYISGGRNISDEYFGLSPSYNFIDRDVVVHGPSAAQAERSFSELWYSNLTERLWPGPGVFPGWAFVCRQVSHSRVIQVRRYLASEGARLRQGTPVRTCSSVRFVTDSPGLAQAVLQSRANGSNVASPAAVLKEKRVTQRVVRFLNGTRRSLDVENWVYMPIHSLYTAFESLRAKNIPVRVMTNQDMDESNDVLRQAEEYTIFHFANLDTVGSQSVARVSSVGRAGTRFRLTPPGAPFFLHGKVALRDSADLIVSSFNVDPRSYNLNLESVVEIRNCPELAEDAQKPFDDLRSAYRADLGDPSLPAPEEYSSVARWFASIFWEQF